MCSTKNDDDSVMILVRVIILQHPLLLPLNKPTLHYDQCDENANERMLVIKIDFTLNNFSLNLPFRFFYFHEKNALTSKHFFAFAIHMKVSKNSVSKFIFTFIITEKPRHWQAYFWLAWVCVLRCSIDFRFVSHATQLMHHFHQPIQYPF